MMGFARIKRLINEFNSMGNQNTTSYIKFFEIFYDKVYYIFASFNAKKKKIRSVEIKIS